MSGAVDHLLARAQRRQLQIEAIRRFALGLAAGGAVAVGLRLAGLPLAFPVAAGVAGSLLGLATVRRVDDLTLAARLDRAAGLGSALTAAVEFRHRHDPWATAQRAATAPRLAHLDLATLLPWRGHAWGIVAAALGAATLLVPDLRHATRVPPPPTLLGESIAGTARPTGAGYAPQPRLHTPAEPPITPLSHAGANGDGGATAETGKGVGERAGSGGGGGGAGLGNAPASGGLVAATPRPELQGSGPTVAVATTGRGPLPTPLAAAPPPAPTAAGRLAPDPLAALPLYRRAAVARYFELLRAAEGR